jgi:hypothetical protein
MSLHAQEGGGGFKKARDRDKKEKSEAEMLARAGMALTPENYLFNDKNNKRQQKIQ